MTFENEARLDVVCSLSNIFLIVITRVNFVLKSVKNCGIFKHFKRGSLWEMWVEFVKINNNLLHEMYQI